MAFPTIHNCIVCESVRHEVGGKFILLGYYGIAPYVRIYIGDFTKPITLCFYFSGDPGTGRFRVNFRLRGPSGNVIPHNSAPAEGELRSDLGYSFFILFFCEPLPGPGRYQVSLVVDDDREYFPSYFELALGSSKK